MFGDIGSFRIINKINQFSRKSRNKFNKKIILCVPNTLILIFRKKLKSKFISLGVQNCHHHKGYGPFTGSVSSSMLKKSGAEFIILGHSENRSEGETNQLIKKKIQAALSEKLNIIFCIGETLKEKNSGKTSFILKKQIRSSIQKDFNINKIIFAYEPIWSIGTNQIPKVDELSKIIRSIKNEIKIIFKRVKSPRVLYGGSVNDKNIRSFSSISDIDGFLIGGASQSSKKFIDIVKNYYK